LFYIKRELFPYQTGQKEFAGWERNGTIINRGCRCSKLGGFCFELSDIEASPVLSNDINHFLKPFIALRSSSNPLNPLALSNRSLQDVVRSSPSVWAGAEACVLCISQTGTAPCFLYVLLHLSCTDYLFYGLVLKGCGLGCCRWYRTAFVSVDEAQPSSFPTCPIRYPYGPRYAPSSPHKLRRVKKKLLIYGNLQVSLPISATSTLRAQSRDTIQPRQDLESV
jgi:hypothetical protein